MSLWVVFSEWDPLKKHKKDYELKRKITMGKLFVGSSLWWSPFVFVFTPLMWPPAHVHKHESQLTPCRLNRWGHTRNEKEHPSCTSICPVLLSFMASGSPLWLTATCRLPWLPPAEHIHYYPLTLAYTHRQRFYPYHYVSMMISTYVKRPWEPDILKVMCASCASNNNTCFFSGLLCFKLVIVLYQTEHVWVVATHATSAAELLLYRIQVQLLSRYILDIDVCQLW